MKAERKNADDRPGKGHPVNADSVHATSVKRIYFKNPFDRRYFSATVEAICPSTAILAFRV